MELTVDHQDDNHEVQRSTDWPVQSDIDIVVVRPETEEASDEEEGNDNIWNHDNDDLPCDTAGEIEVHSKKEFESSESSCSHAKKLKPKTEAFKLIKKNH
ncbi:hypothetical protein AVEN_168198-1 [Araneus ventricosus]|uniref:Uncharacterized protein n=1 Tax=Araneus ventricosus TaxID=182803 RepID=A0A4Y2QEZ5_ARAVE|nr:hypothetical protein AVEN_168198-1 [Araneus ventricosus]